MRLLIRGSRSDYGERVSVVPNGVDWKYVDFRVVRIAAGETYVAESRENEVGLVFIEGTAGVRSSRGDWESVGGRATPFDGPPQAIYLPPDTNYRIAATTAVEVAICGAVAGDRSHPAPQARRSRDSRVDHQSARPSG